jgi:hypothetical protein
MLTHMSIELTWIEHQKSIAVGLITIIDEDTLVDSPKPQPI